MSEPRAFLVEPRCAVCGRIATRVELRREDSGWRFVYKGIAGGNGAGDVVDDCTAALLTDAFTDYPNFDLMRKAGLHYDNAGFCEPCHLAYCYTHWSTSVSGYGMCPQGHGKSLDPHGSPQ
jgi:hypothetical protein